MGFFQTLWADFEATWAKIFGSGSGTTITATAVSDIKVVASALMGALSSFESLTGLDSAAVAKIQSTVAAMEAGALQVIADMEKNAAQPIVSALVSDFNDFKSVLPASLPSALSNILKAVTTLIPYIEAGVGLLTAANANASGTVSASESTGLSADEARLILGGASAVAATKA